MPTEILLNHRPGPVFTIGTIVVEFKSKHVFFYVWDIINLVVKMALEIWIQLKWQLPYLNFFLIAIGGCVGHCHCVFDSQLFAKRLSSMISHEVTLWGGILCRCGYCETYLVGLGIRTYHSAVSCTFLCRQSHQGHFSLGPIQVHKLNCFSSTFCW